MDSVGRLLSVTLAVAVLSGCATAKTDEDAQLELNRLILDSARTIQAAQAELYRAAALNAPVVAADERIASDRQPLTFSWKGDASQLLQALARQRGYNFSVEGLRLPLPMNIDVKDQPFPAVIDLVRAQVGYRASISVSLGKLTLSYHKPSL